MVWSDFRAIFHLLVAILIDDVVEMYVVIDLIMIVNDSFDTSMLFWPVHLELLAEPRARHIMSLSG